MIYPYIIDNIIPYFAISNKPELQWLSVKPKLDDVYKIFPKIKSYIPFHKIHDT